jgi:predicted acylesterase/phospholipase RssA
MRALVLSGGGSAGSFQCGALKYLFEDLGNTYQLFTGVSVGALNASWMAQYAPADQKLGYQALYNLWYNIQDSTVKKNWCPWNIVKGLWSDSVYNSQPLIDLVHNHISLDKIRASGNKVAVSATEICTGKYHTFTQDDGYFIDSILASSSFPMGLIPIVINGIKYTDGGVRHSTPINEAIAMGATDLDIVLCGPKMPSSSFNDVDVVTYGLRCFDYMTDQMVQSDIKMMFMYNKLVSAGLQPDKKFLNVKIIRPSSDLPNSSLSFDNATMRLLLQQGYDQCKLQYKP